MSSLSDNPASDEVVSKTWTRSRKLLFIVSAASLWVLAITHMHGVLTPFGEMFVSWCASILFVGYLLLPGQYLGVVPGLLLSISFWTWALIKIDNYIEARRGTPGRPLSKKAAEHFQK